LSRHVTPRHHTTPHAFWLCQACRTARLDTRVSTRSTRQTCRVVSRRDVTSEVKFGLMGSQLQLQIDIRSKGQRRGRNERLSLWCCRPIRNRKCIHAVLLWGLEACPL